MSAFRGRIGTMVAWLQPRCWVILGCRTGRIAVDECLRVLVTKHLDKDHLGEDHPDHGPTSVKDVRPCPEGTSMSYLCHCMRCLRLYMHVPQSIAWQLMTL